MGIFVIIFRPHIDLDIIDSVSGELLLHLFCLSGSDRLDRDNRTDTDHNSEHREKRPQLVGPKAVQRKSDIFKKHAYLPLLLCLCFFLSKCKVAEIAACMQFPRLPGRSVNLPPSGAFTGNTPVDKR